MRTQISFTTEENLKRRAQERAREEGISLKTLFVFSMKSFVDGKIKVGITAPQEAEVEEFSIEDKTLRVKAKKLAKLLQ